MDVEKMMALVAAGKILKRVLVKCTDVEGQHWPSDEPGKIPVFQAYCKCGLRLPAYPSLTIVLEHFRVELVYLVPNSITMLNIFMYLCEAYLGIHPNLDLFKYYYGIGKQRGIASSCAIQLHDGKLRERQEDEEVHPHVHPVVVARMEEEVVLLENHPRR